MGELLLGSKNVSLTASRTQLGTKLLSWGPKCTLNCLFASQKACLTALSGVKKSRAVPSWAPKCVLNSFENLNGYKTALLGARKCGGESSRESKCIFKRPLSGQDTNFTSLGAKMSWRFL